MVERLVFVVNGPRHGSAVMRGYQQAESIREVGGHTRVLDRHADRPSLLALRDATVVLVKEAVLDDDLVLALSLGGNRLVWDAVDHIAHKPPLSLEETPAQHLAPHAAAELVSVVLAMTAPMADLATEVFASLDAVHRVDHQIDRRLADRRPVDDPRFGVGYLGAPENLPAWTEHESSIEVFLTSPADVVRQAASAAELAFHLDVRNPLRDRRDFKPWTKVATTAALGALPIAEATAANVDALGADWPWLFDGSSIDFAECLDRARRAHADGRLSDHVARLDTVRERAHPHTVARRLLALL